jgi:hypothetical protein
MKTHIFHINIFMELEQLFKQAYQQTY